MEADKKGSLPAVAASGGSKWRSSTPESEGEAAQKALALDASSAEGHAALGSSSWLEASCWAMSHVCRASPRKKRGPGMTLSRACCVATASATVHRSIDVTLLTVVDANVQRQAQLI